MGSVEIFVLSTALGMDLFSVAIPIGMHRIKRVVILKASFIFALFHIVMLLSGYYTGRFLGDALERLGACSDSSTLMMENCAGIVGAIVLTGLGVLMIKENFAPKAEASKKRGDILRGWALLVLAFSVSVDAMAAGFSFGMMEVDLIKLNLILGSVIFMISVIGLSVGKQAGRFFGESAELFGGIILILLGGHVLWRLLA